MPVVAGAQGRGVGCAGAGGRRDTAAAEPALFEAMLEGWGRQQRSRRLSGPLVESRERLVRRFQAFTMAWPWAWTPEQVEAWSGSGGWAHSTIRSYQGALAVFLDYACDARYGWLAECEQRVGARPVQVCHEWNTAVHVADYEGRVPCRKSHIGSELVLSVPVRLLSDTR